MRHIKIYKMPKVLLSGIKNKCVSVVYAKFLSYKDTTPFSRYSRTRTTHKSPNLGLYGFYGGGDS
jgi:hypothetical protein